MDIVSSIKSGLRPNFMISLVAALVVLALVNSFLPANYKLSKYIGSLFS